MQVPTRPLHLGLSLIIPFIGTLGSIFLFGFSVRRRRYYHLTSTEFLIASLSLFNLVKIALYLLIAHAAYYEGTWSHGLFFCKIVSKSGAVTFLMTEFIIVFITHLHYRLIVRDQFYVDVSRKSASYACLLAFLIACGSMGIPRFYEWDVKIYDISQNATSTNYLMQSGRNNQITQSTNTSYAFTGVVKACAINLDEGRIYALIAVLALLFLPTIYLVCTTILLRHKLRISLQKIRSHMNVMYYKIRVKENTRLFRVLATTTIGFTFSYVPLTALHFFEYYNNTNKTDQEKLVALYSWYALLLFALTAVDTCSTPLAYLAFHPSSRRMLYKLVCCSCRKYVFKRRKTVKLARGKQESSTSSTFTLKSTV